MDKTKHTPGPWVFDPETGEVFYEDDDAFPVVATANLYDAPPEQAEADADLIAAAPDLLDALRSVARLNDPRIARDALRRLGYPVGDEEA